MQNAIIPLALIGLSLTIFAALTLVAILYVSKREKSYRHVVNLLPLGAIMTGLVDGVFMALVVFYDVPTPYSVLTNAIMAAVAALAICAIGVFLRFKFEHRWN